MSFHLAVDCSGSTSDNRMYWSRVREIYGEVKDRNPHLIFWDHQAKALNVHEFSDMISRERGFGGTQPSSFIPMLQSGDSCIVITDGQIDEAEVQTCEHLFSDKKLNDMRMEFVGDKNQMNLSVGASFGKHTETYSLHVNSEILSTGKTVELKPYYKNPTKFFQDAEQLLKDVTMASLSGSNIPLRNQLLALQQNLLSAITKEASHKSENDFWEDLRNASDYVARLSAVARSAGSGTDSPAKKVEFIIREMTKQCEGKNGFAFTLLEPGRLTRSAALQRQTPREIELEITDTFYCPCLMEEDACCLYIKQGRPVLEGLEKSELEYYLTTPFALVKNKELVQKIKVRLDHPVGLTVSKPLFVSGSPVSPLTRAPISSAIILSQEKEAVKVTNYALADLFFGMKLVGVPEFWLYNVFYALSHVAYLSELKERFQQYFVDRCKTQETRITLTGLPVEPMMNAPVDISVWYSALSYKIQPDDERNRLRSFGAAGKILFDMLDLFSLPYNRLEVEYYMAKCALFKQMMRGEKENRGINNDKLRSHFQNHIMVEGKYIFLDGSNCCPSWAPSPSFPSPHPFPAHNTISSELNTTPSSQNTSYLFSSLESEMFKLGLSLPTFVELVSLLDTTKAASAIPISYEEISVKRSNELLEKMKLGENHVKTNYGYRDDVDYSKVVTEICPETMRPYSYVNGVHWKELSEQTFGPLSKQISLRNYYTRYVMERSEYPTRNSFLIYIAEKEKNKGINPLNSTSEQRISEMYAVPRDTLPKQIEVLVDRLFESYSVITQNVSPQEFKRRAYKSLNPAERSILDGTSQ